MWYLLDTTLDTLKHCAVVCTPDILCVVFSLCSKPGSHWHHLPGVLRPLHCHPLSSPWMDLWQLHVQMCCLSTAGKNMTHVFFKYIITIIIMFFLAQKCAFTHTLAQTHTHRSAIFMCRHLSNMSDLLLKKTNKNYNSINSLTGTTFRIDFITQLCVIEKYNFVIHSWRSQLVLLKLQ